MQREFDTAEEVVRHELRHKWCSDNHKTGGAWEGKPNPTIISPTPTTTTTYPMRSKLALAKVIIQIKLILSTSNITRRPFTNITGTKNIMWFALLTELKATAPKTGPIRANNLILCIKHQPINCRSQPAAAAWQPVALAQGRA